MVKIIRNIEEYISVAIFTVIFLLMFMGVVNRYFFKYSLPWNIELARYAFVWLSFIGLAFVRKEDGHIRLDVLYTFISRKLPDKVKHAVWFIKKGFTFFFLYQLIHLGIVLSQRTLRFKSQAMQISQSWLYISVSVGGALYLLSEIYLSYREFRESIYR